MVKKWTVLLAGLSVLLLMGCRTGMKGVFKVSVPRKEEKTVVTALYHKRLDRFEELVESTYEDIDLEVEPSTLSTYNSDILRRLRNGHGKDLILTSMPNSEIADYMLDLSAEEFSVRYGDATMETMRYQGRTICLPMPGIYRGTVINQTLVEQLGREVPRTREEFLALLQAASETGTGMGEDGAVFAVRDIDGISLGEMFFSSIVPDFLGTMEGERWLGAFLNKEAAMEGVMESQLQFVLELARKGYTDPGRIAAFSSSKRGVDVVRRMVDRELLAAYATSDILKEIRCENTEDVFMMLPFLGSGEHSAWVTAAPAAYLGINRVVEEDEKRLDACKRVLNLFSTAVGQEAVLEDTQTDRSYLVTQEVRSAGKSHTGLEDYVERGYVYDLNRFHSDILWLFGRNIAQVCNGWMELPQALAEVDDLNRNGTIHNEGNHTLIGSVSEDLLYENYNTRYGETAIGNLITDAVAEVSGADIAVINGGAIRASLYAGDVYISDLAAVCPYRNTIVTVEMTGVVLREMLENGISEIYYHRTPGGKFLQVHGLHYAVSVDRSAETADGLGSEPAGTELISMTLPDGTPIRDDKSYKVAVTSYMCGISGYEDGGGDGYTMLNLFSHELPKAEGVILLEDTGITHEEALIRYFRNHNREEITSETEGRITVRVTGGLDG